MSIPKIKLKHTDLEVSRFCFGTMTFGKPLDQAGSTELVNRCIDAGINFFDTANMYQAGIAETMLGNAMKSKRVDVVIASKVFFKMGEEPDQQGLSRKAIVRALDESLRRLGTDYLDIYYLHAPDHVVAIEESLEAMETLVKQGKVRYVASSITPAGRSWRCYGLPESGDGMLPAFRNLCTTCWRAALSRSIWRCASASGISTVVYNPLAGGLLTGKPSDDGHAGHALDNNKLYQDRYWHEQYFQAVEQLRKIAQSAGRSLVSLALNWLLHHTASDCIILGRITLGATRREPGDRGAWAAV